MGEITNNNQETIDELVKEEKLFKLKGKILVIIDWANVYGWLEKLRWGIDPQKLYDYLKSYLEIFDINFYFGVEKGNKKSEKFQQTIKDIGYTLISKEVKWVPVSLEKSHFKNLIKELFNVLDNVKNTNSKISNKLYELTKKVDGLPKINVSDQDPPDTSRQEKLGGIYNLIDELDYDLKGLNEDIGVLQQNLIKPVFRRKCDFDCEISLDILNNLENLDGLILFSGDGDYKIIVEYLLDNKKQVIVVHPFGVRGREYNELLEREEYRPYLCAVEKLTQFIKS